MRFLNWAAAATGYLLLFSGELAIAGNPECVHAAGREACASQVSNPISGEEIWTLWNDTWRQELRWSPLGGLVMTDLKHWLDETQTSSVSWLPASATERQRLYEFRIKGYVSASPEVFSGPSTTDGFTLVGSELMSDPAEGFVQLRIDLEKHRPLSIQLPELDLRLSLFYRCYADGSMETQSELLNLGTATLWTEYLASFCLTFDRQSGTGTEWRMRQLGTGFQMKDTYIGCPGNSHTLTDTGWFGIHEDGGGAMSDGFTGGFVMPNLAAALPFEIDLTLVDPARELLRVSASVYCEQNGPGQCWRPLPSGATKVAPAFYGGFYSTPALRSMARVHQDYQLAHHRPALPTTFPFVEYNNYFKDFNDYDTDTLWEEALDVGALGLGGEVFVIDAGWNHGTARVSGDYSFGLGYWFASNCKFPDAGPVDGFVQLLGDMSTIGLSPGLWVYPLLVDEVLNDPAHAAEIPCWYQSPPPDDCFCDGPGDLSCTPWTADMLSDQYESPHDCPENEPCWVACKSGAGQTVWLCGANSGTYDWVDAMLRHVTSDYSLGYIKIEGGSMPPECGRHSLHADHVRDDGGRLVSDTSLEGMYRLFDGLRKQDPELVVEAEWPLGHLSFFEDPFDPDSVDPRVSRLKAESGRWFSLASYASNYLYGAPVAEMIPAGTTAEDYWPYWVRSRMLGGFNISSDLATWPTEFLVLVQSHVAFFKAHRRFQRGPSFNLLSQAQWDEAVGRDVDTHVVCQCPSSTCLPLDTTWDAVEFLDASAAEAQVYAFRNASSWSTVQLVLEGLDPGANYDIYLFDAGIPVGQASGASLMDTGYALSLPDLWSSEIVTFVKS